MQSCFLLSRIHLEFPFFNEIKHVTVLLTMLRLFSLTIAEKFSRPEKKIIKNNRREDIVMRAFLCALFLLVAGASAAYKGQLVLCCVVYCVCCVFCVVCCLLRCDFSLRSLSPCLCSHALSFGRDRPVWSEHRRRLDQQCRGGRLRECHHHLGQPPCHL